MLCYELLIGTAYALALFECHFRELVSSSHSSHGLTADGHFIIVDDRLYIVDKLGFIRISRKFTKIEDILYAYLVT